MKNSEATETIMHSADISYRPMNDNDGNIIRNFFYHAIYIPPDKPKPDKSIIDLPELLKYHDDWGQATDLGFLALYRDGVAGAAWIRLLTGDNKGYGYVDDDTPELTIAVLPDYRNMGIGSSLITRICDAAKPQYARISLSVSKGNPAFRLYERTGFVQVAENEQDLIMVKDL